MSDLFIGLISGTSMDGIDAALVDFGAAQPAVVQAQTTPYSAPLRDALGAALERPAELGLSTTATLDAELGDAFGQAALALLTAAQLEPASITAIGSHGQNVYHAPDAQPALTVQLGDPNRIAERAGITTVADFRRRDVAAGGQGAPLAPILHRALLHSSTEDRAVLNLGGIANLTLLPQESDAAVTGFDVGPANCLLDDWIGQCRQQAYDSSGAWARQGKVNQAVLAALSADPYFARLPPKSTGREYFNLGWLTELLELGIAEPVDVQRTLLELTAQTVAAALSSAQDSCARLLVCGGGVHNKLLLERLGELLPGTTIESTASHGVNPDFVEAALFAWLARQTLRGQAGNVPSVTGAAGERILGGIYRA